MSKYFQYFCCKVFPSFLFKGHLNKVFVIDIQIWDFFPQIFFSDSQRQYPPTKRELPTGFPKHRNFLQELEEKSSFQSVSSHSWNQCPSIHVDGFKDSLKYIICRMLNKYTRTKQTVQEMWFWLAGLAGRISLTLATGCSRLGIKHNNTI